MSGLLETTALPEGRQVTLHELSNGNTFESRYQQNTEISGGLKTNFYQKIPSLSLTKSSAAGYNMGLDQSKTTSDAKIMQLFNFYKDPNEDAILAEGIEKFCNDLQIAPDDFRILVLAWKLDAEQMCKFTRQEFTQGLKSMNADSIKSIQHKLPELVQEVERNPEYFKSLYRFTFRFGLDVANGQRILPSDMAVLLWKLVFTICEPPILQKWLEYSEKHPNVRGIPKDTWYMFLNFSETVGSDLSGYDDTEAWPSLFDDFVEYENDQTNQNISKIEVKKHGDEDDHMDCGE